MMKYSGTGARTLGTLSAILSLFLLTQCSRQATPGPTDGPGAIAADLSKDLQVYDFVATNVFWDGLEATRKLYPGIALTRRENAKFAVLFTRRVAQGEIESIRVDGPGGYTFDFDVRRPFDRRRLSGYVEDGQITWYMIYDTRGFLQEGEYRITVTKGDGTTLRMAKTLELDLSLLEGYLDTSRSYAPKGIIAEDPDGLWLEWPLVRGKDAYYCSRVQEVGKDFATGNAHFDNIFLRDGAAGLNQDRIRVIAPLEKGKPYVWFTEILDSNRLRDVDMAIFQEFQFFQIQ